MFHGAEFNIKGYENEKDSLFGDQLQNETDGSMNKVADSLSYKQSIWIEIVFFSLAKNGNNEQME